MAASLRLLARRTHEREQRPLSQVNKREPIYRTASSPEQGAPFATQDCSAGKSIVLALTARRSTHLKYTILAQ